jgi:hypothetical protein
MPRRKTQRSKKRVPPNKRGSPLDIPSRSVRPQITHTYRFASDSAVNQTITERDVLKAFGMMCTITNSSMKSIVSSARIHYVEVWVPVPTVGSICSVNLNWSSDASVGNRDTTYSDASINPNRPAHIHATPPRGSAQSLWFNETGDEILFQIITDSACILDIHMSGTLHDGTSDSSTYVVTTATIGRVYFPPLDGPTDALIPVGLQTAT